MAHEVTNMCIRVGHPSRMYTELADSTGPARASLVVGRRAAHHAAETRAESNRIAGDPEAQPRQSTLEAKSTPASGSAFVCVCVCVRARARACFDVPHVQ